MHRRPPLYAHGLSWRFLRSMEEYEMVFLALYADRGCFGMDGRLVWKKQKYRSCRITTAAMYSRGCAGLTARLWGKSCAFWEAGFRPRGWQTSLPGADGDGSAARSVLYGALAGCGKRRKNTTEACSENRQFSIPYGYRWRGENQPHKKRKDDFLPPFIFRQCRLA